MEAELVVNSKKKRRIQLATFSNGTVKPEHSGDLNCCLLGRTDTRDRRAAQQNILVAECPGMTYVGKNFGPTAVEKAHKYYVGLFDKKAGKMEICDAQMFLMDPHVPGLEKEEDKDSKTRGEKKDMLIRAFGSSKRKKELESRERNKVSDMALQGVMNQTIDHGIEQAQNYKEKQDASPEDTEKYSVIPPCNMDAETENDVYQLSDIISDEDMNALHNNAAAFFEYQPEQIETWDSEGNVPKYVLARLPYMPAAGEPRWHMCKCLLYLSYLIQLFKMKAKQLDLKSPLPDDWPQSIKSKLLNDYTLQMLVGNRKRRCFPSRLKDRLLAYILTLCLLLEEYRIEIETMMKDLQVTKQKLETHVRALGCKLEYRVVDKKRVTYAVLKVPVVLSEPRKRGEHSR